MRDSLIHSFDFASSAYNLNKLMGEVILLTDSVLSLSIITCSLKLHVQVNIM